MTHTDERLALSVAEAARKLGLCRGAVYQAIKRKEIPVIRVGDRVLIPRRKFEAMLGLR